MNCSLPGSSVRGLLQARILEWVAMPSSKGGGIESCIQGLNPGLLHCRQILYHLSHQGSSMSKDEMAWHMRGAVKSLAGFEGLEIEFKPYSIIFELKLITHYYFVRLIL